MHERFGKAGIAREQMRATCVFRYPGPPAAFLDTFQRYYGPTMNAFAAAAADGRVNELREELVSLFEAQNQAGSEDTVIPATFLKVIVDKL